LEAGPQSKVGKLLLVAAHFLFLSLDKFVGEQVGLERVSPSPMAFMNFLRTFYSAFIRGRIE
jgi:hypothetical protein